MKHLAFQREFLSERVATFSGIGRWLWSLQFQTIHVITTTVVAWDHRHALRALGVKPADFRQRCIQAWKRWQAKLNQDVTNPVFAQSCPRAEGQNAISA